MDPVDRSAPEDSLNAAATRKRWVIFAVVGGLALALLFWMARRDHSSAPDLTGLAAVESRVPSAPKVAMDLLDDPSTDGWPTEQLAEDAKMQLKELGRWIVNPGEREPLPLGEIVTEGIAFGALVPERLERQYSDSVLTVERMPTGDRTAPDGQGIAAFEAMLDELETSFSGTSDARFAVKVFKVSVEPDNGGFTTQQYVALSGRSEAGVIEMHATWRILWNTAQDGSTVRMARLQVTDFERVNSRTAGRTLFTDCTQSVLGSDPTYAAQIARGFNHWIHRIQDTQYFFWLGIPGIALGDVNGDGLEDFYFCQEDGLPNRLYLQNADGTLRDESDSAGVNWLEGSRSALLLDLDNDGDQDLAVAIMGGIVLAANRGDGRFDLRGVLRTSHDVMSICAADYDQDGRLDLYACAYWRNQSGNRSSPAQRSAGSFVYHDSNTGGANSLFRNETDTPDDWTFRNVTAKTGLDEHNQRWSLAAAWEDFDNDGDQDLYVANDFGRNCLYRNEGGGKFVDVAGAADVEDSASGMAVTWADFNRDGMMDVYVSNMFSAAGSRVTFQSQFKPDAPQEVRHRLQRFARGSTLMRNLDGNSFEDVSADARVAVARWAWGTKFIDINNSGWQDLLVANGNVTGEDSGDL